MGVELNFLSKKRRVIKAAWILGVAAVLSFALLAGVVHQQWGQAVAATTAAEVDPVYEMAMELNRSKTNTPPHIELYQDIQSVLGKGASIELYTFDGMESAELTVSFTSFDEVDRAMNQLQSLRYVRAVQAGDVENASEGYHAAWILDINRSALHALRMEKEGD